MTIDEQSAQTRNEISGGVQHGPVLLAHTINATFHVAAAVPAALSQLPPMTAVFTGREGELAMLAELLDPAGSVMLSVVAGLAGVGKTTLAVSAGHAAQQQGWFPGGVLFMDLHGYDDGPVAPGQALDALLRALGMPAEQIPPTTDERAGLYRSVLARIRKPVLVIADNASTEEQVRLLMPSTGPHKMLVTSRRTLAGLAARLVDLTTLDSTASIAMLDTSLGAARPGDDRITSDPDAVGRLASVCGGLPLALQIVAALLIADPALSPSELANDLAVEPARLEQLVYEDGSSTTGLSVAGAFDMSVRRLNKTTALVFRMLSANPGPDTSTAAAAVLADLAVGPVRKILADLAQAHLIEAAPGSTGRWRMHDLVRLHALQLASADVGADEWQRARDRLLEHYLHTAGAADQHLRARSGMGVPSEFDDRGHALDWLDAERANLVAAVSMAAETGRDEAAMRLPLVLLQYLERRRRFDDWLAVVSISLAMARRLGTRQGEGDALNSLGVGQRYLRRFEAASTAHRDAAAIYRETGDRHSEGAALNNLGAALQEARRFEQAIAALQDAAAIYRETGDRHSEGAALNNLGAALHGARRFEEAIAAHHDAAGIYRETADRHAEGTALCNLGVALLDMRQFGEARTVLQDAAAIFRETGDRHAEGTALGNLGITLRKMRKFREATTVLQDAVAIFRETGDRHAEGLALGNLGNALYDVRRFEEAITAHQGDLAISCDTHDRYREAIALTNLGYVLQEVRRLDDAITAHQDAVAIFREIGDRHGEATAVDNLGVALREEGQFKTAVAAHQDAAAIFQETRDRQAEGTALCNLGNAFHKLRQFSEAITAYQEAAAIFREIGDRHSEATAVDYLGVVLQGRYSGNLPASGDTANEVGARRSATTARPT